MDISFHENTHMKPVPTSCYMLKSSQKCNQNITPAIARSVSPAPRLDPAKNDVLVYWLQKIWQIREKSNISTELVKTFNKIKNYLTDSTILNTGETGDINGPA